MTASLGPAGGSAHHERLPSSFFIGWYDSPVPSKLRPVRTPVAQGGVEGHGEDGRGQPDHRVTPAGGLLLELRHQEPPDAAAVVVTPHERARQALTPAAQHPDDLAAIHRDQHDRGADDSGDRRAVGPVSYT